MNRWGIKKKNHFENPIGVSMGKPSVQTWAAGFDVDREEKNSGNLIGRECLRLVRETETGNGGRKEEKGVIRRKS